MTLGARARTGTGRGPSLGPLDERCGLVLGDSRDRPQRASPRLSGGDITRCSAPDFEESTARARADTEATHVPVADRAANPPARARRPCGRHAGLPRLRSRGASSSTSKKEWTGGEHVCRAEGAPYGSSAASRGAPANTTSGNGSTRRAREQAGEQGLRIVVASVIESHATGRASRSSSPPDRRLAVARRARRRARLTASASAASRSSRIRRARSRGGAGGDGAWLRTGRADAHARVRRPRPSTTKPLVARPYGPAGHDHGGCGDSSRAVQTDLAEWAEGRQAPDAATSARWYSSSSSFSRRTFGKKRNTTVAPTRTATIPAT